MMLAVWLGLFIGIPIGMLIERTPKYDVCKQCGFRIRVNKFILGSLHLCSDEESR